MYKRHYRLTLAGTIHGGAEIFSCSVSLEPDGSLFSELLTDVGIAQVFQDYLDSSPNALFDDIVADCTAFWSNAKISQSARLTRVKMAVIKEDGHYAGAPKEAAVSVVSNDFSGAAFPWQISQKCTLETDGDLGRIKGGFYLPLPLMTFDYASDLWDATEVAAQGANVDSFLEALANVPGPDDDSFRVVIASQGRHNRDGSVRLGPDNYEVKRVHMGRRPDVIRRRANAVLESRVAATNVSQ